VIRLGKALERVRLLLRFWSFDSPNSLLSPLSCATPYPEETDRGFVFVDALTDEGVVVEAEEEEEEKRSNRRTGGFPNRNQLAPDISVFFIGISIDV
jgi:hypothetical protein